MKAKMKLTRLWSFLLTLVMVVGLLPTVAYAETSTVYITKIEINDFNPEFHTGMTGTAAKKSLTFSYPDDANYSKDNDNIFIKQNGSFIYGNNLTAGEATLIIPAYANPFGNNEENPAYDFDKDNLNSIEVWINGEKRTDVEVKGYNSAWRKVEIYIPVTVSEYTGLTHTVTFDSNGGTAVESQQVVNSGYASEPSKPTKDGKVFIGWYTDPELTTKFNFSSIPITSDITLYAKWEDKVVTQYITKIEINNFNPKFHTGMTGDAATDSLTFSYPDDANYSKGNDNRYIKQNGSFIYDNNLTAGAATLMISVYANPFGNNVENPAYDFDEANLNSIEVWIDGEKRTDVEVKGYNSAWRKVDIYIPVTVSEYTSLNHTVSFAANGGTGTMADVTGVSGDYVLPVCDFTAPNGKQFKAWSVGGVEKAAGDKITVTANTTVTAIWEAVEYNVTVTGGTASVSAGTPITKATMGTTVTLTANAASDGMIFDKWVVEDGSASITLADANSATTTFTMPAGEVSVKATYRSYITINLAAGEGSGTMEPLILKATYGYYELIAPDCTFTPPANKVFDKWQFSKDDSYLKPGDTKTIWSSANGATLTAIWKDAPVTPAINSVTVSPATAGVTKGKTQQFTATVDKTGDIADTVTWSVNSTKSTISDTGLLTVGADETAKTLTVTATSTADTTKSGTATVTVKVPVFYITVTNGKVTDGAGNSLVAVPEGAGIIFTANEPETGKQFKEWTGLDGVEFVDGTSKTSSTAKIKMPARAVTATAVYEDAPNANPAKPTISVNGTYIYTGSEQTATVSGYDSTTMNITGNVGTNAGGYTVSVTSKTGKWADGTTDAVTADWSIQKANPTYEVPTGLEGTKGNALSTVTLPAGFTWADGTTEMNTTGNQTFPATFTPSDTDNYNVVNNISVTVNVKEAAPTTYEVTVTNGTGGGNYEEGATVSITANAAPSGQMFDKWEVVSGSITLADANSATTTFTMPAGEVSVKATYKAAPHTHTFDQETIKDAALKTAADCTHDAVYYKSCSCGAISTNDADTFTAAGSALGHDYTKKVENNTYLKTAASKCTEYNVYWYACSRCDANAKDDAAATDKYYTSTTAGNHSFTEKIEDAAHYVAGTGTNCQSVKKYYYDCAYCDQIGTTTWNSTTYGPHDYDTVWSNDKSGHWHECSLCHDKKDEAAHTPGAAATETTPQKCTECDYIITPALGHTHSLTPVAAKDATCTNDGNTAYYVCSGCSKWYEDAAGNVEITDHSSVVRGALGHNWKAATCTAPKTCNTCGATEGDPLGHSEGTEWKYDSENHWHTCTVAGCGVLIDSSKAAHTPDRAAATETDPIKCSVCGYVITPASGHTHDVDTTKYESDETNHWNTCSGCSEKLNISAHDFEWKIDKDATATEKGSKHEECMVCGYARPAVEIPATGSTPEPGDNSNMFLWIALLSVSGVGVVTIIVYVYVKKRKSVK